MEAPILHSDSSNSLVAHMLYNAQDSYQNRIGMSPEQVSQKPIVHFFSHCLYPSGFCLSIFWGKKAFCCTLAIRKMIKQTFSNNPHLPELGLVKVSAIFSWIACASEQSRGYIVNYKGFSAPQKLSSYVWSAVIARWGGTFHLLPRQKKPFWSRFKEGHKESVFNWQVQWIHLLIEAQLIH